MQAIELDAGEIFRTIGLESIADDEPPSAEALQVHIGAGTAWVAELDGRVVGYVRSSVVDQEGHIDQVSVARSAAGHGIGAALIGTVCDWAAGIGFEAVTLTTFTEVAWNGPYYQRLGFSPLPEAELGPELAAIRRWETNAGLDVSPRVAMRKPLA